MAPRDADDEDATAAEACAVTRVSKKSKKRKCEDADGPSGDATASTPKKKKKKQVRAATDDEENDAESLEAAGETDDASKKAGKKRRWASAADKVKQKDDEVKEEDSEAKDVETEGSSKVNFQVFISGLPFSMDEASVRADFSGCGEIAELVMPRDKHTGQVRGFAYITFTSAEAVQDALKYDGHMYGKRWIQVKLAEPLDTGKQAAKKAIAEKNKSWSLSEKPEDCTCVVMKGLSYDATEEEISAFFSGCGGEVEKVRILKFQDSGKPRGMAFVDFENTEGVDAAMKLAGLQLKGRKVVLDYARSTSKTA